MVISWSRQLGMNKRPLATVLNVKNPFISLYNGVPALWCVYTAQYFTYISSYLSTGSWLNIHKQIALIR